MATQNECRSWPATKIKAICLLVFVVGSGGLLWLRFARGEDLAHDFTAFYVAGKIPLASLYNQNAFRSLGERTLGPLGIEYYPPYVRPAIFAVPLRLIAWMPYWTSFGFWLASGFACYWIALAIAFRSYRPPLWALAGFGFFYPAVLGPTVGQDANLLAVIVAISTVLLVSGRDGAAGAVLACGLCKFSLMGLFPLVFLLKGQRRAFVWFLSSGILLAIASILLSSPYAYVTLLRHVRDYTGVTGNTAYGIRGFATYIGAPWVYYPCAAALVILTIVAIRRLPVEEAFCVAAIAGLLSAYQAEWYDAPLLIAPLCAGLARNSTATFLPACFLLLFPAWTSSPGIMTIPLAMLYAGFVIPALRGRPDVGATSVRVGR